MPLVTLRDGQRMHVRVLGRGSPCVLVHGFASDGGSWLPFIAPLLHRHRFIVPDLRGFGGSSALGLSHACPLTSYAEDLGCLAEALDLKRVPLVGISMGALSAVRCFEHGHGQRYGRYMHIDQGLVIHNDGDASHGLLGPAQPGFFGRVQAVLEALSTLPELVYTSLSPALKRQLSQVFAEFAAAAFTAPSLRGVVARLTAQPQLLPWFLPAAGFTTHVQIMRAYLERRYDLRDAFRKLGVPTTMLIGGASRMYPAAGQRAAGALAPEVRVRELAGVGHMLPLEAPRLFLRELRAFLAD